MEENQLISALAIMEAPIVIKERFNIMKELGRTRDAITFARVAGGGNECIHFLLTEGFVDEAMVQASISKNVEGLSQLSKDLLSTNPCASVLCIHAHIIGVMEGLESQNCHKFPEEGIDNLVDILGGKWFKPPGNDKFTSLAIQERHGADRLDVPSLHLLSIVSLAEAMLRAAKSTSDMQAILEQQHFAECGISPLLATIAITARATSTKANVGTLDALLKHLLGSSGLRILAVNDGHGGVSGWLTRFGLIPKALGEKDYLELVCFLYKSARFLIEKGCGSQFCFTLALFSSVQIGVMTGYESVAMDMIGSVLQFEEDGSSMSPLSILSVCYTALSLDVVMTSARIFNVLSLRHFCVQKLSCQAHICGDKHLTKTYSDLVCGSQPRSCDIKGLKVQRLLWSITLSHISRKIAISLIVLLSRLS